jgi:pilus assembly protein CpaE
MIKKILIVDDEVETLRLISIALRRQGLQVINANNGTQALELAITENPNLIILDIMMPDISGFEVVKRLKKNKKTTDIPVLIFSARNQLDDKVTGYESGADDYLTKPIHPAELISHVKTLLDKSTSPEPTHRTASYTVGVMGAVGGAGASTMAVNLACNAAQHLHSRVVLAEMTPGHGSFLNFYGSESKKTLEDFLKMPIPEIDGQSLQTELIRMNYGPLVLAASDQLENIKYGQAVDQAELVVQELSNLAPLLFLDFGTMCWSNYARMLSQCDELILITAPFPSIIEKTRKLITQVSAYEFDSLKPLTLVSISQARSSISLTLSQMEEQIHHSIAHVIPASPEQAYQAENAHKPISFLRPNDLVSQQIVNASLKLVERYQEYKNSRENAPSGKE